MNRSQGPLHRAARRCLAPLRAALALAALIAACLLLAATAPAAALIWDGDPNANWDINTSTNWTGESTYFNNGDAVTFSNVSPSGTAIAITGGGVAPLSTTFASNALNYTFTGGGILGGSLTVNGGTQTFNNGANTLSGATTINAGATLTLTGSATLPNTTLTINRGALNIIGTSTNTRLNDTNAVTLRSGTIEVNNFNVANSIMDETIGAINFSGTSRLSAVRGRKDGGASDLAILRVASLNRVDRGMLELNRTGAATRAAITVTGTAPSVTNGTVSPHFIMFASTDIPPSTQPTFATYITSGTPGVSTGQFDAATASGTGLQTVLITAGNTGSSTAYFASNAGGTLAIVGAEVKNIYAGRISRSFSGGASTTLRIHGGGLIMEHATPGSTVSLDLLNIDFPTGVEGVIYTGRTAAETHIINGVISGDTGLTKGGPATLVLGGNNDWTGATQANNVLTINSGVLRLDGGSTPTDSWVRVADGATFSINALSPTILGLVGMGTLLNGNATDRTLTIDNATGTNYEFEGVLANGGGGGQLALVKRGSATQTLAGANTFSGATTVEAGTLEALGNGTLGSTASINITGGTLLLTKAGGGNSTIINDTAGITLGNSSGTPGVLKFGSNLDETVGVLTLSGNSVIDLYKLGSTGSVIRFGNSTGTWTGNLSIHNWLQEGGGGINTRIYFGTTSGGLSSTQLSQISGFSGPGSGPLGTPTLADDGELIFSPIPEPGTVAVVLLLGLFLAWRERGTLSVLVFRRRLTRSA
jgi:autotransporter-associated beta strand protein